jgi:hypothetical protein
MANKKRDKTKQPNPRRTVKTFIKDVAFGHGTWCSVIVELSEHAGRKYIHLRRFNKHRTKLVWYPTQRFFTIPVENAPALAEALCCAAAGSEGKKPDWLIEREKEEAAASAERTDTVAGTEAA